MRTGKSGSGIHPSWTEVLSDPVRLAVVASLVELGEASAGELSERCHASGPTLRRHLEALETPGLVRERRVESDGTNRGRPASRFSLHPRTRESALALLAVLREPLRPWPRRTPLPAPARGRERG